RARNHRIRFGSFSLRARAAALVGRSSSFEKAVAIENGILARAFSAVQRLHDVFFHDNGKTVGRLETRRRRNLVSDHALRLVPFSGCGVVSNAVGLLAGRAWFAPDRGQFSIFGVDAITFPHSLS